MTAMDALLVGRAAVALGAGRDKKGDQVDLSAGILLHKKPGEPVASGEPILELRYNDAARLDAALHLVTQAVVIGDQPPPAAPLVMGWVHAHGETMFVGGMCVDVLSRLQPLFGLVGILALAYLLYTNRRAMSLR